MPVLIETEDEFDLSSVGLDIGSATTHFTISKLTVKKVGPRYVVIDRAATFESTVLLTPYRSDNEIDGEALADFFHAEFERAGVRPANIDTGALILTGVALERENAQQIAAIFAEEAGRFVSVSAGDELEAMLSAQGSGALAASRERGIKIVNIDIGGGTTKVVVCDSGDVTGSAIFDVGARLVAVDDEGRVTRTERFGLLAAEALGIDLRVGELLEESDRARIAAFLITQLMTQLVDGEATTELPIRRAGSNPSLRDVDALTLSGGVSELFRDAAHRDLGDLGVGMAATLREELGPVDLPILPLSGGIRATVLGASQYTVQVSGSTIYVSSADVLPIRNAPTLVPLFDLSDEQIKPELLATEINALIRSRGVAPEEPVALAVRWRGSATWDRLHAVAAGLYEGVGGSRSGSVILACDDDVARLLGRRLSEIDPDLPVASVDGVNVSEFGFLDIGSFLPDSNSVPVVVKSLVF
ncbi:MAG: ethanolamine utilization protein EutA [Actinophytocola sp.]|uniref:ethanolamine ammonia-lyase reactivating factor EutA n=1 Tax=Actinophytocola sp. TaxID=1872138 RepID=UPI001325DA41|nr:ethanolamine ammonia-lyase reactivating factor EutA [Actinophytocola sp.]MPZ82501.1 ethanolamine utilization protein EutA [Actinophytocola sp.]